MPIRIPQDEAAGLLGNLPGTESTGLILTEVVTLERKSAGVWSATATGVPATFDVVSIHTRVELEPWSHKPLYCLWLPGDTLVADGDRAVRADGSHWYVRGAPLVSPLGGSVVALVERSSEDGLFAARSASEPV